MRRTSSCAQRNRPSCGIDIRKHKQQFSPKREIVRSLAFGARPFFNLARNAKSVARPTTNSNLTVAATGSNVVTKGADAHSGDIMSWRYLLCGAALLPLAGCANFFSIDRETDIVSTRGKGERATAIHLDAKQRLVFSDANALCAEPSPDALSALASSFGGGLTLEGRDAVSAAQALQESAGSIGLRTQSITLMRDTLYRVCEAYHNNALGEADVLQLLQRSQDLTMGVLAIEQLTGAVAAQQVALGGSANASAASSLQTTQEILNKAKEETAKKLAAKDRAAEATKKTQGEIEAEKSRPLPEGLTDEQKADEEAKRKNKIAELEAQLRRDQDAEKAADSAHKDAQEYEKNVERNRDAAYTSASAAASGSGHFTQGGRSVALDEKSTDRIAAAVENIVSNVVNKSHFTDTCINMMSRTKDYGDPKYIDQQLKAKVIDWCDKAIAENVDAHKRFSIAHAEAYRDYYKSPTPMPKPKPKPGDQIGPTKVPDPPRAPQSQ